MVLQPCFLLLAVLAWRTSASHARIHARLDLSAQRTDRGIRLELLGTEALPLGAERHEIDAPHTFPCWHFRRHSILGRREMGLRHPS